MVVEDQDDIEEVEIGDEEVDFLVDDLEEGTKVVAQVDVHQVVDTEVDELDDLNRLEEEENQEEETHTAGKNNIKKVFASKQRLFVLFFPTIRVSSS